jgi:hypothetical protein
MGRTALAPLTPPVLAVPAALLGILPLWFLITILAVSVALTAAHVIVTQVIRLRASTKITTSAHALQLLTVEATARTTRRARPPRSR